jgi:hypothetical protein
MLNSTVAVTGHNHILFLNGYSVFKEQLFATVSSQQKDTGTLTLLSLSLGTGH